MPGRSGRASHQDHGRRLPAYASLSALPEAPDATFIGVNRFATLEVVEELRRIGGGGAICFASGWEEAGEAGLQDRLVAAAGDMPILGPNCYGVINYLDGALLWPDQHGGVRVDSGVALVSQSSNIVINMGCSSAACRWPMSPVWAMPPSSAWPS